MSETGGQLEMFMIVPPLNPWDKPKGDIMLRSGLHSIGITAGAAWHQHTQGDMSKVQAWFDRGYRLRRVRVELLPETDAPTHPENT